MGRRRRALVVHCGRLNVIGTSWYCVYCYVGQGKEAVLDQRDRWGGVGGGSLCVKQGGPRCGICGDTARARTYALWAVLCLGLVVTSSACTKVGALYAGPGKTLHLLMWQRIRGGAREVLGEQCLHLLGATAQQWPSNDPMHAVLRSQRQ